MAAKKSKKTARSVSARKKAETASLVVETSVQMPKKSSRKTLYWLILVGALLGLGYYFKSIFVAATVNGEPIARLSVIQEVEKQGGRQILDTLVNERLIMQEARAQGINVTQADTDAEISLIEEQVQAQGQTLDEILTLQGMTREDLNKQMKIQVIVKKLMEDKVSISDDEVVAYMEENKDYLPEASDEAQLKEQVREQLTQQKMSEQFQTLLTDLKEKASVNYFVKY
ncbi:hypothetical protein C4564_01105 [Candidatus Microgenomates bacterium]|nr:MAG: hypothetical protein C4564_01105 [Candidatus Microgenomates bacterium]